VRRLDEKQREIFADYFKKVALLAITSLFFSQFIPGQRINWWMVVGGVILSLVLIVSAAIIGREITVKE